MNKFMLLLITSLIFSQQLQVDGNLKVTGEIDAQGQAIKNVGVPQSATDAVNLATAQGLAGMKPVRIYSYHREWGQDFTLTVPDGKMWIIKGLGFSGSSIDIYGITIELFDGSSGSAVALPGQVITPSDVSESSFILNIFEYPIQSSGIDQGMDYIVP